MDRQTSSLPVMMLQYYVVCGFPIVIPLPIFAPSTSASECCANINIVQELCVRVCAAFHQIGILTEAA